MQAIRRVCCEKDVRVFCARNKFPREVECFVIDSVLEDRRTFGMISFALMYPAKRVTGRGLKHVTVRLFWRCYRSLHYCCNDCIYSVISENICIQLNAVTRDLNPEGIIRFIDRQTDDGASKHPWTWVAFRILLPHYSRPQDQPVLGSIRTSYHHG